MLARAIPALLGNKKSTLREQCAYQKNLLTLYQKNGETFNMTYLIIATIILALTEIIVLPFASKRLSILNLEDVEDETI